MKRIAIVGIAALAMHLNAAPSVEITNVQQQYPWTNTVDITYNVSGITNKDYFVVFEAKDADSNLLGAQTNVLETSGTGQVAQWEPPFNIRKLNCTMTPYVYRGGQDDYMIVDLETWQVTYEGIVGSQEDANNKYNTNNVYKTSKLVLRRVEKGNYQIGVSDISVTGGSGTNITHTINVPKDYYVAIFETTESQFMRMNGDTIETESTIPKRSISWNTIRGAAGAASTPGNGVLKNLNTNTSRTGFDLPTESMWEIAMRAGVLTRYPWGDSTTGYGDWCWTKNNASSVQTVGSKKPNAWGIFDVVGNIAEIGRDVARTSSQDLKDVASQAANALAPISSGSAGYCNLKADATYIHDITGEGFRISSVYASLATSASGGHYGFRIAYYH